MRYGYQCDSCGYLIEEEFPVGSAPAQIQCMCNKMAYRIYACHVSVPYPTHPARANRGKGK